jgi:hypothetical protein
MSTPGLVDWILLLSLALYTGIYIFVSRREGSYFNVLTPAFVVSIPAFYFLPWFYFHVFGNENSLYAYVYVYATITLENAAFAYMYTRKGKKIIRMPLHYAYSNFGTLSVVFLGLAALMYVPILLQFRDYLLSPREIYANTRTGFGINFFISSTLAYLAVILALFSRQSRKAKWTIVGVAAAVLVFHGSKGQVLSLVFFLALFQIYVRKRKLSLWRSITAGLGLAVLGLLLFVTTMVLSNDPSEMLETISSYSDYTRNAMLVIDSSFPRQYGRLTLEMQTTARIPRALMPNKPKDFGAFRLADWFYPGAMDADAGAPDFGIGVQYADFGAFAIVYLALFAMLRGWLAQVFRRRLEQTGHPADFLLLTFFAGVSVFPVGGVGWMLPEALAAALFLRFASCVGASRLYREHSRKEFLFPAAGGAEPSY